MRYKLVFFLLIISTWCKSQTYPSSIVTVLTPPYSIFMDSYTDPFQSKIKATILFHDYTEPSWNVYLKIKITSSNVTLETKPGFRPPTPIVVSPGVPHEISGADLAPYFNYDNLTFSGISRQQLEVNNRLPEGMYSFCFEVMDYNTGKQISLQSCSGAYLSLNDPPIVIAPVCGNAIESINQQNIIFQWQISNTNGNLNVANLNYQINLYEVNNPTANPQTAILNNQALPIWESPLLLQNTYIYGITEPPLEKTKKYVFTVKAIEQNGRCQIKNNGYSQPCWFSYGYPEGGTIPIISLPDNTQLRQTDNGFFKWQKPSNVISSAQLVSYQLNIAPLLFGQDAATALLNNTPFYKANITANTSSDVSFGLPTANMMQLQKMKPYVWQVKGFSGQQEIAKSSIYHFAGPPAVEKFFAANFEVNVTQVTSFDTITGVCSGKGKVVLNSSGEAPEFSFNNITLSSIGNNTWVMSSGVIYDKIICSSYTFTPTAIDVNNNVAFNVDSIHIDKDYLRLCGSSSWKFPLVAKNNQIPYINTKRQKLILSNGSFNLSGDYPTTLATNYNIPLLEPGGFNLLLDNSSVFTVNQSKYDFSFNGNAQMPASVKDGIGTTVTVPFANAHQLFYIQQQNSNTSEGIRLVNNTGLDLRPRNYVLDFSEIQSPGDFSSDSLWKGLYIEVGDLFIPKLSESSGQLSATNNLNILFNNQVNDSVSAFVDQNGLTFKGEINSNPYGDTLRFNTFATSSNKFKFDIQQNQVNVSRLIGNIQIAVVDTAAYFPYYIQLDESGFGQGYLVNSLVGKQFIFNPAGGQEQTINMTIKRAVFQNNNHLEMEMDLSWSHFTLNVTGIQKFCAWGNGNIGFDVPNGTAPLTYEATGKKSGYDLQVDHIGCGRTQNLYAFGISAKIQMSEDISGADGAPVVNAYSIYKNPIIAGYYIPGSNTSGLNVVSDSTKTPQYTSSTTTYTTAMSGSFSDAAGSLGVSSTSDTTFSVSNNANDNSNALISSTAYLELQEIITIAERLTPFIKEEKQQKYADYIAVIKEVVNSNVVKSAVNTDAKDFVNNLLMEVVESIIFKINQPIQNISTKAQMAIRNEIVNVVVKPVNNKIDTLIAKIVDKIRDGVTGTISDDNTKIVVAGVFNTAKADVTNGINQSIANSVEKNITSKITNLIQYGVTAKITGFIATEVRGVGSDLIHNGANAHINFDNILQNAGTLFVDVADTVVTAVKSITFSSVLNTAESLGSDAVTGINWDQITQKILQDLVVQGVEKEVTNLITQQLGAAAGGVASQVLSSVKFDFSNIGEKLKDGKIDQIVKLDAITITIKTSPADISGRLKFTKDDPIWGDSFQAMVDVTLRVPKRDQPIEVAAMFINGKTTQEVTNYAYWFFSLTVGGLNIPLTPMPLTLDAIEGHIFHHMQKPINQSPTPFVNTNYGVGVRFFFYDTPLAGKIVTFNVGLDVTINTGSFDIELNGTANIGNLGGKASMLPPVASAIGKLGYYSADKKFAGDFDLKFNTSPLFCAGGDMGINIDGKKHTWEVWIGKKESPLICQLLCKSTLGAYSYFDVKNTGLQVGLGLNISVEANTPWIGPSAIQVRGTAGFGFGFDANADVSFEPSFKINEAYIHAWANAEIGFDYKTALHNGHVTIAGVSLDGSLLYKSTPSAEVHGTMSGKVTILDIDVGVDMDVNYDIGNHKMM
jgi:hypothetical protein